ncbi:protein lin-37-like isoform X1 [Dinothrombium tinctorium]|uniref:Protein lin-37-like isoform X1 n=1 Tax=Dinothrombium tinctorium TaxID=1965070 RepID=A0A3S3SKJ2_9ACAR|nr:protein lin-37-like isoform X1 [Dinothrombium tinctorium]
MAPKNEHFGELDSARIKLNDVLDHIWKEENVTEEDYDVDDALDSCPSPQNKMKRSRGPRKTKKRMREDGYTKTSSFVVKLFDRSIDLAQFSQSSANEDSSLYPVCRAWIRNQSQSPYFEDMNDVTEKYTSDDGENIEKPPGILTLPPPLPLPKDETSGYGCVRIPKFSKDHRVCKSPIDDALNSNKNESYHNLLENNLTHWKQVRQQWKRAIQDNEARYKHSCNILQAMYER